MAIKTKKISDLGSINFESGSVILGCTSDVTGKIEYSKICDLISEIVNAAINKTEVKNVQEKVAFASMRNAEISDSVSSLQTEIVNLKSENEKLTKECKDLLTQINTHVKACDDAILSLQSSIHTNSVDIEKVINFIKELQKDKYLTLAEIKKAAANAFPASEETIA